MVSTDWHVSFHSLKRVDNSGSAEWIFENDVQQDSIVLEPLGLLDFRPLATPPKKRSKAREWTQIAMSDEDNWPGCVPGKWGQC